MAKPSFVIVVRASWQQSPPRNIDGILFAQQVGTSFKWDVLGFLGKACGIRDDRLEKGRSVESLARLYPQTKGMWPPELNNVLEGAIGRVNDYGTPGPEKEAELKALFERHMKIDLHFVDTWAEEAQLRAKLNAETPV